MKNNFRSFTECKYSKDISKINNPIMLLKIMILLIVMKNGESGFPHRFSVNDIVSKCYGPLFVYEMFQSLIKLLGHDFYGIRHILEHLKYVLFFASS